MCTQLRGVSTVVLSAGLAVGGSPGAASGQVLTPPDGVAAAQSWAYSPSYSQQVSGVNGTVTQFQLIVSAGAATGGAWHSDAVIQLTSPNNTTLLLGGNTAGGYPGALAWTALPYTGTLPPESGNPVSINATFDYNFGPPNGAWSFNFRNQWSDGTLPWSNIQIVLITNAQGACCLLNGACISTTSGQCSQQGGIFQGDETNCSTVSCPQPAACCLPNGLCLMTFASACATAGGVFNVGSVCGAINCPLPPGTWAEQGDAGELPQSAQTTQGADPLVMIRGVNSGSGDVDMYRIRICNPGAFIATTLQGAAWDTQLFLFDAAGLGVASNDDAVGTTSLQSRITGQFVSAQGEYLLAISGYNRDPLSGGSSLIFDPPNPRSEVPANGPGAAAPVDSWSATSAISGGYDILLAGACFAEPAGPSCYANCDASTVAPVLNVADFACFLTKFAEGNPYANCDASTTEPMLNVADFSCFLTKFASGCS